MQYSPGGRWTAIARFLARGIFALAFAASLTLHAEPASYQVNDRVETNFSVFGWQKGTIKEVGTGVHEGELRILTDGYAKDTWVGPKMHKFIRRIAEAAAPANPAEENQAPRLGKYLISSYGAPAKPPLRLGYFELRAGGSYKFLDLGGKVTGDGKYEYEANSHEVRWISGPFLANKWGGKFEISRAGKTHSIRLTRSTHGENSTK